MCAAEVRGLPEYVPLLAAALEQVDDGKVGEWGAELAARVRRGARVLVAGNGGSAAQAQHLVAELVGRFVDERWPLPAVALSADTAVGNDYGFDEVFARQVRAHARPGDVLVVLSVSGRSPNVLQAVQAARELGVTTWALTGAAPNPVAAACEDRIAIDAAAVPTVQECHLVVAHRLCAAVDRALCARSADTVQPVPPARSLSMAVVGDVLLDRDWDGEADRLSPEAPVPVVDVTSRRERAGGAGLAAVLAVADGHRVTLVTALGGDEAGRRVRELLAQAGVRVVDLGAAGPTVVKIRVRARGQTVLRVDEGTLSGGEVGAWTPEAADAIEAAQCVLVADYGRGVAASAGVRAAIAGRVGQVPIVWDPHPRGAQPVAGISVVVPNRDEAAAALHESTQTGSLAVDVDRARRLRAYWRVGYVAVTRGPLGAVLVDADATAPLVVGAPRVAVGDSSGAGDRFAVTMTAELGAAAGPSTAVARAVHAATGFVDAGHHTIVTAAGLEVPDGWGLVARMRAEGRTVVATGGCFDLLHAGHVETLRQARDLGDCLVVCLNSDASVARLKGAARPVVPVSERAALLQALGCVDAVLVFDEDTPAQLLRRMRPDIWVKGGDYAGVELPEQSVLAEWGGQVVLVPYREGLSTTTLIARAAGGVGR